MTRQSLAEQLGVSLRTIKYWGSQGAPLDKGPIAVQKWVDARKNGGRKSSAPESPRSSETESAQPENLKARLLLAQAENLEARTRLAELERQVKVGELVPLTEVEVLLRKWIGPVTEHLRTQPQRLANLVNPADPEHARDVLEQERQAIFRLAKEVIGQ